MIGIRPEFSYHDWGSISGVAGTDLVLFLFTVNLQVEFARPGKSLVPYVFAGGGVAQYEAKVGAVTDTFDGGAFHLGGGVMAYLERYDLRDLYFAPEVEYVRDSTDLSGNNLRFAFAIGWNFY